MTGNINGYIKLFRSINKWEWKQEPNVVALFVHCLVNANFQDSMWKRQKIKRGELVTSYQSLSADTGLTIQQARTALSKLIASGDVSVRYPQGRHYTIIIVNKFNEYQEQQSNNIAQSTQNQGFKGLAYGVSNNQITINQQSNNNQITTDKEYKEYKNIRNKEDIRKYTNKEYSLSNTKNTVKDINTNTVKDINTKINKYPNKEYSNTTRDFPTDKQSGRGSKNPIYYPNDETLNRAFTDYVDMRKKIKAPMTDRAVELAMKKLHTLSAGDNDKAVEILNQSVMNSWKGLFELKEDKKSQNQQGRLDWLDNIIANEQQSKGVFE